MLKFAVNIFILFLIHQLVRSEHCPVYLTLSPITKNLEDSHIIINWGPTCESPPDWIALYKENPSISDVKPIFGVIVKNETIGHVVTNEKFKLRQNDLPGGWSSEEVLKQIPKRTKKVICFDFYVVSYRNKHLESLDCLKIHPYWMFHQKGIGKMQLKNLFLPGTHCSGCFMTKANAMHGILRRIGFTQELNIWSQLVYGIRYLDFSIGHFPSKFQNSSRNFFIMNGGLKIQQLTSVLQDIRKFAILSEEILILDFRRFTPGFYSHPDVHIELIKFLDNELGDIAFRRDSMDANKDYLSFNFTVDDLRKQGKFVIISYGHERVFNETDLIWMPWKKYSSEYLKTNELAEYMQNIFAGKMKDSPKDIGWTFYGIQGIHSSLEETEEISSPRNRAHNINSQLISMLAGPWSLKANGVLLDFFTNTNLVDIAIQVNQHKILQASGQDKTVIDIM